ncbi:beta-L-arabinofuranosidase domain-containing protein [candidate division KSB1 bacterium]
MIIKRVLLDISSFFIYKRFITALLLSISFLIQCEPGTPSSHAIIQEQLAAFETSPSEVRKKYEAAENLAVEWLMNNFNDEGYFTYVYDPEENNYPKSNNMIRQLMASRVLAELSQNDPALCSLHERNLTYIFTHWYMEFLGHGCIYFNNSSKLGSMAMALRTLTVSPLFEDYSAYAQKFAETILYLQNPNGSFKANLIEPNRAFDPEYSLKFYSGEAILSLLEYFEKTGKTEILDAAVKSQEYYLDQYVTHLEHNYYPAYVPWHTMSLSKLYKTTGEKKYADAIFILNDEVLKLQNQSGKPDMKYLGRFYNPDYKDFGTPHSSSDGIYTEGLAYAYEIAGMTEDKEHIETYKTALILAVDNLMRLQFSEEESLMYEYPERVSGGIRYNADDTRIRIDTTQHTADAITKVLEVLF